MTEKDNDYYIIPFPNEFSEQEVEDVLIKVRKSVQDHNTPILLDCSGKEMMYSAGLGFVIQIYKICNGAEIYFALVNVNQEIKKIITTTKLNQIINVFSIIEEFEIMKIDQEMAGIRVPALDFSYQEKKNGFTLFICNGIMSVGPVFEQMISGVDRGKPVVFDFSNLDFIDGVCVRDLDILCGRTKVYYFNPNNMVSEELDLLGLKIKMISCSSLQDAKQKCGL